MKLMESALDFRFDTSTKEHPDAYQRLLLDALVGDASLFARSDEVELAWEIIDPIIAAWRSPAAPVMHTYPRRLGGRRLRQHGWRLKDDIGLMFAL